MGLAHQEGDPWLWAFTRETFVWLWLKRGGATKLQTACLGGLDWGTVLWPWFSSAACRDGPGNWSSALPLLHPWLQAHSACLLSFRLESECSLRTKGACGAVSGCASWVGVHQMTHWRQIIELPFGPESVCLSLSLSLLGTGSSPSWS